MKINDHLNAEVNPSEICILYSVVRNWFLHALVVKENQTHPT